MMDVEQLDFDIVAGKRNYLIFSDESGVHGSIYYGYGTLWMPYERRGDFSQLIQELRTRHNYTSEIKWQKVTPRTEPFYRDLVSEFFQRRWLMFHCLIARKGYTKKQCHKDFDEELRKRFSLLISTKVRSFCSDDPKKQYHVRVDPLPSRYGKADEAAHKIIAATLKRELGLDPVKTLITKNSADTPGIQLADLLLGAVLSNWQGEISAQHKLRTSAFVANHLGWSDLHADTRHSEWKFNIWYFYDPTSGLPREIQTRAVQLVYPMPQWVRRAGVR